MGEEGRKGRGGDGACLGPFHNGRLCLAAGHGELGWGCGNVGESGGFDCADADPDSVWSVVEAQAKGEIERRDRGSGEERGKYSQSINDCRICTCPSFSHRWAICKRQNTGLGEVWFVPIFVSNAAADRVWNVDDASGKENYQ